jgi:hypothetical protein
MENKTGKYFKYAIGEIFLVVIGILIALQINNLNEKRKNESKTKVYYRLILIDLETDETYIKRIKSQIDSNRVSSKKFNEIFEQPNVPLNELRKNFANLNWNAIAIDFQSTTISTLENTGDIQLITPSILSKLVNYKKNQEEIKASAKIKNQAFMNEGTYAQRLYGGRNLLRSSSNQTKISENIRSEQNEINIIKGLASSQSLKDWAESEIYNSFEVLMKDLNDLRRLITTELDN